jgi:hypothetical protein
VFIRSLTNTFTVAKTQIKVSIKGFGLSKDYGHDDEKL